MHYLDIVIVAEEASWDELAVCAQTVEATAGFPHRLFLATSHTPDDVAESRLRSAGIQVIICEPSGLGGAALRNLGLRASHSDFVVLLDGRTLPDKGWLDPLVQAAQADDRVVVAGGVIVRSNSHEISQAGIYIAEDSHPLYSQREEFYQFFSPESIDKYPPAVSGNCMLIRRSVLEAIAQFDSNYYGEFDDIDFCLRARAAGYEVVLCPTSVHWYREPSRIANLQHREKNRERLQSLIQSSDVLKGLLCRSVREAPLVSLLYPAYNDTAFLEQNIESVINQTYRNWELVIVNDASTDNTPEILNNYCAAYPERIKVFHKKNHNRFEAWDMCYAHSRGEYLSILGADDVLLPWCLEEQVQALEANPWAFVYSDAYRFDSESKLIDHARIDPPEPDQQLVRLVGLNYVFTPSVLMRRSAVEAAGGWLNRKFMYSQDYDLWLRLLHGRKNGHIARPLIKYRKHKAQLTEVIGSEKMFASGAALIRDKFERWRPEDFFPALDLNTAKGQTAAFNRIGGIFFSWQTALCGLQPDVLEFFRSLIDCRAKDRKARRAKFVLLLGAAYYFCKKRQYGLAIHQLWRAFREGAAFEKELYVALWRKVRKAIAREPSSQNTQGVAK
ncbi:MAG TPA: glycosyltransferase [Pyrinomonadaceae bacterium]|jgi:GT2 family glycosyltransferase